MNCSLKKLLTFAAITVSALLGACTSEADKAAAAEAGARLQREARSAGAAEEAAKAEQRYLIAKTAVEQKAREEVSKAGLQHASGCNIVPHGLLDSPAYKALAQTGKSVYVTACEKQVGANIAAAKQKARDGMIAEKAKQQKLAAAKAKHEQKLAKLKACDKIPGRAQRDACVASAKRHV